MSQRCIERDSRRSRTSSGICRGRTDVPFCFLRKVACLFWTVYRYLFRPKLMSGRLKCSPDLQPTVTLKWTGGLSTVESDSRADAGRGAKVCPRLIRKPRERRQTEIDREKDEEEVVPIEKSHPLFSLFSSSSAEYCREK